MKYAIFILTNGRPDNQITFNTLQKLGVSAPIFLLVDDEDETRNEYIKKYGNIVLTFSKSKTNVDTFDNFRGNKAILWARNAVYDMSKTIGFDHFVMLDDDYSDFEYRYIKDFKMKEIKPKNTVNLCFESFFKFLDYTPNLGCVCFSQGGDFCGGVQNNAVANGYRRKAMNCFFCRTDRRIEFSGRLNEDVTSYTLNASRGIGMITVFKAMVRQLKTQSIGGGITELYNAVGTYQKTFYSLIAMPSAISISSFGFGHSTRIHHNVSFDHACPCFISDKFKKA